MTQPPARRTEEMPADYPRFLAEVKVRIAAARTRAVLAVNSELIQLYWEIGQEILERQDHEGWGSGVTKRLSTDLRREFADMKGLSETNLRHMRAFAQAWPDWEICSQAVSKLPWGHNLELVYKLADREARQWYAHEAVENGWSRNVLQAQIASDLRGRQGSALTSFDHALPAPDSELVRDAIKDPYNFEFLGLSRRAKERELELALLNDIQSFLMEMGRGFALVGRQFPLKIVDEETGEEDEFFIDLLFYNYLLRRFVVIDLKVEDFKPEFAGKMSFYLTAVDELERQPADEPSIGLVLCPGRRKTVTEWALRGVDRPVAVARYTTGDVTLTETPPAEMTLALPELPKLASELSSIVEEARAGEGDPTTEAARRWLIRFIDTYEGMDAGPGDPVHAVREKARELLSTGPTKEDPFTISKQIAAALPGDSRAAALGDGWCEELQRLVS